MDKMDGLSLNLEKNNIDKIKELFPEAVEEGKINFDMLRAMLGDEVDDSREKYQFTWNGKAKAIKLAQTPSSATLRPCKDEKNSKGEPKSKNWDTTENLYIEGDNLEVLKQLQKTYYGKIKMIYIDPPYNTGKDFVYNDSFSNSMENYKEQTNQVSSSNPESNGRFHTDWLNMMYPRLILAKNLLKDDGIIMISISDIEVTNLKSICNEIFGETNFVADLIWANKEGGGSSDSKLFRIKHEHILCFAKNIEFTEVVGIPVSNVERYKGEDEYVQIRGKYYLQKLGMGSIQYSPSLDYPIVAPDGSTIYPSDNNGGKKACWRWSKEKYEKNKMLGFVEIKKDSKDVWTVYTKQYLNCDNDGNIINRTQRPMGIIDEYSSTQASKLLEKLGLNPYFNYSKPIDLLKYIISRFELNNEYILDFFSGSASTAHAVMKLNAEDGGKRKFIMVQLPELFDEKSEAYKAGYKNICEIGEERIRRAGEQIKVEWEKEHPSDGLFGSEEQFTTDIGFKVFKLDSTNVNEWDPNMKLNEKEIAMRLGEVFKEDRSKEDILYEIMLKYGLFDKQVEEIDVNGKTMYRVGKRYMIVCLDDHITSEDVKAIGELSPKAVIFNEAGFNNDNDKINAVYNLEKAGVDEGIKCI